jgi:hypothetical protein
MKTLMATVAWFGIFLLIFGVIIYSDQVIDSLRFYRIITPGMIVDGPAFEWFTILGTLFVLVGGLTSRPHFQWPVLVIAGVIYIVLALINISYEYLFTSNGLSFLIIGLVCIIEGLLIRWVRRRE